LLSALGGIGNSTLSHLVEPRLELLNHEGFERYGSTPIGDGAKLIYSLRCMRDVIASRGRRSPFP
jgi:hypothetical protein